ncbi:COX15/CtaA family protein [Cellulomonas sp. ACRRI]|uniref:COX15/CtaA family protein n=1 Tax=Cellulomonas sp. ACRRI TaxID=2918188 RepID=UPI001EF2E72C|nr:COX15/CtaA family protein [Cellulomonas sp. ACRRI]MCG7285925.1 COX15/CtaA family protein [Cellulomonas sp. ACRRI]
MSPDVAAAPVSPAPTRFAAWRERLTHPVLVANLVAQIGIVVTGGAVRLTGSGLGCSTWPQCEPGQFTAAFHPETTYHQYVEFGNRTLTGVLGVIAVAVALLVWFDRDRSAAYRWLGFAPLAGVVAQALIGGVVVLLHLHPAWVSLHFLVSMALVAASTLLVHRSREGDGPRIPVVGPWSRRLAPVLAVLVAVVLTLGVITTGAGPHSGDEEVGYRIAVDPYLMARVHAASVWLFVAVLAALLWLNRRGPRLLRRRGWVMVGLVALQGVIGYVQVATDLPILLVLLHMLGAALLAAGTTRYLLTFRTRA